MDFILVSEITINNRKIAIFRDKNFRNTFLERNGNEYSYLDYETYIKLDNLYNKKIVYFPDKIKKGQKFNFVPKMLVSVGGALIAVTLTLTGCQSVSATTNIVMPHNLFDAHEFIYEDNYSIDESSKRIYISSADALTNFLPSEYKQNPSYEQLYTAIAENQNIDDNFKIYLNEFVDNLQKANMNLDLRPFYMNIKELKVDYVSAGDMIGITGGEAKGVFVPDQHTIYINREKDESLLSVVRPHEIGHMMNNLYFNYKGYTAIRDFSTSGNYGFMVEEGMDSLFVDTIYGMDPIELPYRVVNNYSKTLIDSTNYSLEDYINGSIKEYEEAINNEIDFSTYQNYSSMDLIYDLSSSGTEYIYEEYNNHNYGNIDTTFAHIYFNNLINQSSSYEEILNVYQKYIDTIIVNNDKGAIVNINAVNAELKAILKSKNIQYDVSDNLYNEDQLSQIISNNYSK